MFTEKKNYGKASLADSRVQFFTCGIGFLCFLGVIWYCWRGSDWTEIDYLNIFFPMVFLVLTILTFIHWRKIAKIAKDYYTDYDKETFKVSGMLYILIGFIFIFLSQVLSDLFISKTIDFFYGISLLILWTIVIVNFLFRQYLARKIVNDGNDRMLF